MDRRSWPWKKKSSSDKAASTTDSTSLSNTVSNQVSQENTKTVDYVQVSLETYAHLTGLQDQVKIFEDQVQVLQEKLSSAQSEMTTKDNLVKQHAKVAEEAVSGWEKAEAEALTLKHQLESVTLLKLTAEERASHLDGALKECMKQIRNVKEESEQKLHDVIFAKTKQWEKVKAELEAKLVNFEQELLRASAENTAVSRALQDRSDMLMKISDEKSQADAEIELLKNNIQSCQREISSLKYELHVVSKELEIRSEEKNMSIRTADVANKQHLEDVKKISKLEAECQRLRGLVRKKLPGAAALAQMKLEVENLGRDYGETRLRQSPAKKSSPHHISTPAPDFTFENIHQYQKENQFLTARLLAMEEETKMLKEALAKRNSELQATRIICAKTASKLRSAEAQMHAPNQQKSSGKLNIDSPFDGTVSQNESNPASLTSMSEDGVDEEGSCSESWATALISELSHFKKEKDVEKSSRVDNSSHMELMDDFLEMERLACLSTVTNGTITTSNDVIDKMKIENPDSTVVSDMQKDGGDREHLASISSANLACTDNEQPAMGNKIDCLMSKLLSRIASLFESQAQDSYMGKLLDDIRCIVQETQEEFHQNSVSCVIEETQSADVGDHKLCHEDMGESAESGICSKQDGNKWTICKLGIDRDLQNAISHVHDFVISLGKEAKDIHGRPSISHGLSEKIQHFSVSVNKVLCNEIRLDDFIVALSHVLSDASEMIISMSSDKGNEGESGSSDCIDKITLLENEATQHGPAKENFSRVCSLDSHSSSDPEIDGPLASDFELKDTGRKFNLQEFEQLKSEKENMEMELARCTELLENTKLQLVETEKNLAGLKSQLDASQKSNGLAETQLKCMAESYKSLESCTQELEAEINQLGMKVETLSNELQEEKRSHQNDLAKYRDLLEQVERNEKCSMCSDADVGNKTKQEREIVAAAEKLAECQETIFLLGRQLQALRPPAEPLGASPERMPLGASPDNRHQMISDFLEDEPGPSGMNHRGMNSPKQSAQFDSDNATAFMTQRTGGESPLDGYNSNMSPSDTEAGTYPRSPISSKRQKHRSSRSSSASSFPSMLPEKHGRGFSRFFSKGKSP